MAQSTISSAFRGATAGVMLLLLGACAPSDRTRSGVAQEPPQDVGTQFPAATVGGAASDYYLTLDRLRVWYAVMRDLQRVALTDTSFHAKFDFPLDSPIEPHIQQIEAVPQVSAALAAHEVSPREYIILTVFAGMRFMTMQMDSVAIDPKLAEFFRRHQAELERLDVSRQQ